jgi:hypothetical protein
MIVHSVAFCVEGIRLCSQCGAMDEPMFQVIQDGLVSPVRISYCEQHFVQLVKREPAIIVCALKGILQRLDQLELSTGIK